MMKTTRHMVFLCIVTPRVTVPLNFGACSMTDAASLLPNALRTPVNRAAAPATGFFAQCHSYRSRRLRAIDESHCFPIGHYSGLASSRRQC
jgi:hypothetical protein